MRTFTGLQLMLINIALGLGTFIQVLDSSIANVAIPYIAGNLSVSADQGTWVITSFAASNAIVLPLTGWLANYFGSVRLFIWSVLLFVLTSFLCGFSTSLTALVIMRVLQGAVAGSLIPLSQSLIVMVNPEEKRGAALGFWAMVVVVAPVLGPIVGGYLTDVYSWPWIFYINVPIGLLSAYIVWYYLRDSDTKIIRNPIDWVGLFLLSASVASLQIMLDKGKDLDWFESPVIIALTLFSAVTLSYFFIWNHFQKHPIVDFSFFKNRNFLFGTITITVGFLLYFGATVTTPLWLQTEQGYTPFWAGVAVSTIGIAPVFLSTTVGRIMHRFDLRLFAAVSFIFFAFGMFYQASFTTQVSIEKIMLARFLQGFGVALFFLPLVQLSLGEISKEKYPSASGLFNFVRILIGSGFGTSLSIQLWTHLETFHHARITEKLTTLNQASTKLFSHLSNIGPQFTPDVINAIVDRQVEQQAYMLATNDIMWLAGWLYLLMIPLIFFCKKIQVSHTIPAAAH